MSVPAALERRLGYSGPALFSYGFRPFFLGGSFWATIALALWMAQLFGALSLPTVFTPIDWHIHEMLYGYVAAIVAGFLLTAIPNWTGRLPICGMPLAALVGLWLVGRVAVLMSAKIGLLTAAAIDVAFLAALAFVAMREIVVGRNWRNLRVMAVLGILIAGNIVFHAEVMAFGTADYSIRVGVGAIIALISLVGGRIIPSFTRNWLARRGGGRLPASFSGFDIAAIATTALSLAAWVAMPDFATTGIALVIAGFAQAVRLTRWAGDRTFADRLVLVLHAGYAFVPIGFLLLGSAVLVPSSVPASAGIHAWTAGAVGLMTLAVMTRASLGHTGQPLAASIGTQAIFALALVAAVLRIAVALGGSVVLVQVAGAAWIAAFGGFVMLYGPMLAGRRPIWAGRR